MPLLQSYLESHSKIWDDLDSEWQALSANHVDPKPVYHSTYRAIRQHHFISICTCFLQIGLDEKSLFYQAMASTGLGSVLRLLLLLGLALCCFQHGRSFAKLQQESAASFRERSGGGLRQKFKEYLDIELNQDEKRLLSKISTAGAEGNGMRSVLLSHHTQGMRFLSTQLHYMLLCVVARTGKVQRYLNRASRDVNS